MSVFSCVQGELAVECCLQLIKELAAVSAQQPVLLAVDDYNALYWTTEYGRTIFREPEGKPAYSVRKPLHVQHLNLVSCHPVPAVVGLGVHATCICWLRMWHAC